MSGEDDELATAYTHFHKMVKQEEGAVRNATLVAVENLQIESATIRADVRANVVASGTLNEGLKALLSSANQSRTLSERKHPRQRYQICRLLAIF